jgi:hypothetical protein
MPELRDLTVDWISLVKRPANGRGLVLRSANGRERPGREVRLLRMDDEQMRAYGIVYAPDDVDSQGDWASANTIRQAADRFMRDGLSRQVDAEHNFRESGHYVAESWIVRGSDPLFPSEKPGAWAVAVQVTDPIEWAGLKSGERTGLSLAGSATVDADSAATKWDSDEARAVLDFFKQLFSKKQQPAEAQDMTEDDVKRIAGEVAKAAIEQFAAGQKSDPNDSAAAQQNRTNDLGEIVKSEMAAALQRHGGELSKLRADLDALAKAASAKGASEGGAGGGLVDDEMEDWL